MAEARKKIDILHEDLMGDIDLLVSRIEALEKNIPVVIEQSVAITLSTEARNMLLKASKDRVTAEVKRWIFFAVAVVLLVFTLAGTVAFKIGKNSGWSAAEATLATQKTAETKKELENAREPKTKKARNEMQ